MKKLEKSNSLKKINKCIGLTIVMLMVSLVFISCDILLTETDDDDNGNGDSAPTADEFEPNDERAEAVAIDLDKKYNARISEKTDDDWFKITPAHGSDTYDKVQISVTDVSTDLFIHIELRGADGGILDSHGTDTGGQDLTYTFATPGADYYVRFSGWNSWQSDHSSSGDYSFTVSNLDANDEYAPNHTFETAEESLEYGTSYDGVIVSKYEDDYYKFTNPTSAVWNSYTFTLTDVSDDLYGKFNRYGADESELGSKGADTAGADLTYNFISNENEFYIRVSGWNSWQSDHSSSGSYTLTPVSNGNDDNEPDDTFEEAREITSFPAENLTGTVLTTAANDGGDYEFFKVDLAAGKKITIEVDPEASDMEVHFNVYDESKNKKHTEDGDDGETIGYIPFNDGSTNTYFYVELGGFLGSSANGDYSISLTEEDYTP